MKLIYPLQEKNKTKINVKYKIKIFVPFFVLKSLFIHICRYVLQISTFLGLDVH